MAYLNEQLGRLREGDSAQVVGTEWFVDATNGNDGNSGHSWGSAFLTMARAFALLSSGDVIRFVGKVREQLTTPVQVFDVSIIGGGNRPRHADAAPAPVGGASAATWTTPASGSTDAPLLKVLQQGWRIENFVMAAHATDSCVQLYRDAGADDAERDASHFEAHNIRFASGQDGIEQVGGCYNVGIFDCSFHDLTGYAIKGGTSTSVAAPYRWQIHRNRFDGCANWIGVWNGNTCQIHDNVITGITTALLNTSGGAGENTILRNAFDIAGADFDPAGGMTGHAEDIWSNYLTDAIETGLPAN
jgi:hypothetical protein